MGGLSRAPSSNLVSREADRALIPSVRPMKRERKTALPPPGQAARESNKMPCRAGRAIQTSLAPLSLSFGLTIRMPTPARRAPRPGPFETSGLWFATHFLAAFIALANGPLLTVGQELDQLRLLNDAPPHSAVPSELTEHR